MTPRVQTLEQSGVRDVTDRVTCGICTKRQVEAEHREQANCRGDRQIRRQAAFDPAVLGDR
jgi:hypothetical protein